MSSKQFAVETTRPGCQLRSDVYSVCRNETRRHVTVMNLRAAMLRQTRGEQLAKRLLVYLSRSSLSFELHLLLNTSHRIAVCCAIVHTSVSFEFRSNRRRPEWLASVSRSLATTRQSLAKCTDESGVELLGSQVRLGVLCLREPVNKAADCRVCLNLRLISGNLMAPANIARQRVFPFASARRHMGIAARCSNSSLFLVHSFGAVSIFRFLLFHCLLVHSQAPRSFVASRSARSPFPVRFPKRAQ